MTTDFQVIIDRGGPWTEARIIGGCLCLLGDCLEILPYLPKCGAIVTDPPYGVRLNTKTASSQRHNGASFGLSRSGSVDYLPIIGDDTPFNPAALLSYPELILWGGNHYADKLPSSSKWLIWDKRCGGTPDDNADCEMAWTNLGGVARIHRQVWRGFFRQGVENVSISGAKLHPAQKPLALMGWCLSFIKRDLILDPFAGSFTTGVAAIQLGRSAILIEIDPTYYALGCRRLEDAARQGKLFPPQPIKQEQGALL